MSDCGKNMLVCSSLSVKYSNFGYRFAVISPVKEYRCLKEKQRQHDRQRHEAICSTQTMKVKLRSVPVF